MKICGLQKMTLLDYPGKIACTVFLGGCNFRCPFCHNSELLDGTAEEIMDAQAFLEFLSKRKGLLDAVCISGGEPTLQPDLVQLFTEIKAMGYLTKLDTNGSRPEALKELVSQGLADYVAMDIKNCLPRYAQTAGAAVQTEQIEASIRFLAEGHVDYEFRTTVVAQLHDTESINRMGAWVASLAQGKKIKRWFIQPFADRDTVMFSGFDAPNHRELSEFVDVLRCFTNETAIRG